MAGSNPRPAASYRAARRNAARESGEDMLKVDGSRRTGTHKRWQSASPKYRPVQPRGWDWRNGGRRERDAARSPEFAAVVKELGLSFKDALRVILGAMPRTGFNR